MKELMQKETKKEITTDKELMSILTSKSTIIFFDDLNKINNSSLERLRKIFPVIILDENKKDVAESMVKSPIETPRLFIADSNIYLHNKEKRYAFGDVNVIEGAKLEKLEAALENKVEIPPKK